MTLVLRPRPTGSSPQVMSSDAAPVANIGQDQLLSCYLSTTSSSLTQVSVTWERTNLSGGVVYQSVNGIPSLGNQNAQFKDRTQLFPAVLVSGNASLLLRSVKSGDQGVYSCTISSSAGGGKVNINLRTAGRMSLSGSTVFALRKNTSYTSALRLCLTTDSEVGEFIAQCAFKTFFTVSAFSAPNFTLSSGSLVATADRWLPKPNVTWADVEGNVLQGNTSFTQNPEGIFSVVGTLQSVNTSSTYTCTINTNLVTAVSQATVTGTLTVHPCMCPQQCQSLSVQVTGGETQTRTRQRTIKEKPTDFTCETRPVKTCSCLLWLSA